MKILSSPSPKSMAVPFVDVDPPYRQCSLSVHDTIADPDIEFDDAGVSIYYYYYQQARQRHEAQMLAAKGQLEQRVEEIARAGKGKPYDCVIGLSGGVDSSYAAQLVKQMGLRPLAVHLDNGWNSEIAVKNIENIVNRLGIDLYTHVIDWEEFRSLQRSYIAAQVVDIEVLTDHAILAVVTRQALEKKIGYIINGCNVQTENILPWSWVHPKGDHVNIKSIHRSFSKVPLRTFPFLDFRLKAYCDRYKPIQHIPILNYISYNKMEVKKSISEQLGWCDYGGKHGESIWTRFYQGYILPQKFRIDKRKAHLSSLIFDGQLSKSEALEELAQPIYDSAQFTLDYEFVLKKLEMSREAFEAYLIQPRRSHYEFDYEMPLSQRYPILGPVKSLYRAMFARGKK